jgi:formylglycine-generating enzyme required for sulfatase activity
MAGNVGEWTNDWFGAYSPNVDGSAVTEPGGVLASSGPFKGRAVRSSPGPPYTGRAARRISNVPVADSKYGHGFRCVRTISP